MHSDMHTYAHQVFTGATYNKWNEGNPKICMPTYKQKKTTLCDLHAQGPKTKCDTQYIRENKKSAKPYPLFRGKRHTINIEQ